MRPTKYAHKTLGFGVPDIWEPHHYRVTVPRRENGSVFIEEVFIGATEINLRAVLDRTHWEVIADPVKKEFNKRLKEQKLAPSRWKLAENPVDRLLGKELCMLAWAIEEMAYEKIWLAVRNWLALLPEERWWLFGMAAREEGWKKALGVALGGEEKDAVDLEAAQRLLVDKKAEEAIETLSELGYNADQIHNAMLYLDIEADPT